MPQITPTWPSSPAKLIVRLYNVRFIQRLFASLLSYLLFLLHLISHPSPSAVLNVFKETAVFKRAQEALQRGCRKLKTSDILTYTLPSLYEITSGIHQRVGWEMDVAGMLLGLCCAEFRVPEFRSGVRQTWIEGFSEVIDQHSETPSVPSTCRRTKRKEFHSPGPTQVGRSTEYRGQRLDGARV